jgi:hypothetical protein
VLSRCLALVSSISLDADRRLLAVWLGVCKLGMCSNSALVMLWTYDSTLSVGSSAWFLRRLQLANVGMWLQLDVCVRMLGILYRWVC